MRVIRVIERVVYRNSNLFLSNTYQYMTIVAILVALLCCSPVQSLFHMIQNKKVKIFEGGNAA